MTTRADGTGRLDEAHIRVHRHHTARAIGDKDARSCNHTVWARSRCRTCVAGKTEGGAANLPEQRIGFASKGSRRIDHIDGGVGPVSQIVEPIRRVEPADIERIYLFAGVRRRPVDRNEIDQAKCWAISRFH